MKERPILFSAPMVRALLAGTKTQTRRVVKPSRGRPIEFLGCGPEGGPDWNNPECWGYEWHDGPAFVTLRSSPSDPETHQYPCPYGQPGDRLWVRESLGYCPEYGHYFAAGDAHGARAYLCSMFDDPEEQTGYSYEGGMREGPVPSIHLPRRYSRITLEVTGVRVERLQDISEADAVAEGVTPQWEPGCSGRLMEALGGFSYRPAASAYADLWEEINAPGSWDENPWVWVVGFKLLKGGE